jgi:hypothetical protein
VVLAEQESKFGRLWLESFSEFDPADWNLMAVRRPWQIMQKHPECIRVEPPESFFKYDWHTMIDIFNGDSYDLNGVYVMHLWESKLYHPILKHITKDDVFRRDCCYYRLAKRYLEMHDQS